MSSLVEFPVDEEYRRNPSMRDDVTHLRSWLRMQPHLPGDLITDLELILVYHSSNYSVRNAKLLLDQHFTMRTHMSFFRLTLDERLENAMQDALLTMLPTPAPDGSKILYSTILSPVATNSSLEEYVRIFLMFMEIWQHEQGTWPGITFIVDLQNVRLSYILKLDPPLLSQFLTYVQESLLANLKVIHFVNAPTYVDTLMMMIKPLMKQSLVQLLHVHRTSNVEGLPNVSGLDLESLRDAALEKIRSNQEFFKKQSEKVVVESKRPRKLKENTMLGVEGTFKQLEID